jgi:ketosteroid isomerase-like protein
MYKTLSIVVCLTFPVLIASAQQRPAQQAINQDVWIPFMQSYANFDTDAFMALHTEDVIRIVRDGGDIILGEEYRNGQDRNNKRSKEAGIERRIELCFLERLAREEIAFESGYYKVISKRPDQEEQTFYGHFHVILKKVEGKWKLWVDSDTSHNGTVTEEDFLSGKLLRL